MYNLLAPLYDFFLDNESNFTYDEIMFHEDGYTLILALLISIPLISFFIFYRILDFVIAKRLHFFIAQIIVVLVVMGTTYGALFQFTSLLDYQGATPEYHINVEVWVMKASLLTSFYSLFFQSVCVFSLRFISINNRYNPF